MITAKNEKVSCPNIQISDCKECCCFVIVSLDIHLLKNLLLLTIIIWNKLHYISSKTVLHPIFFHLQNVFIYARKTFGKSCCFSEIFFFSSVKEKIPIFFKKFKGSMHKLPRNGGSMDPKNKKCLFFSSKRIIID